VGRVLAVQRNTPRCACRCEASRRPYLFTGRYELTGTISGEAQATQWREHVKGPAEKTAPSPLLLDAPNDALEVRFPPSLGPMPGAASRPFCGNAECFGGQV